MNELQAYLEMSLNLPFSMNREERELVFSQGTFFLSVYLKPNGDMFYTILKDKKYFKSIDLYASKAELVKVLGEILKDNHVL